MVSGPEWYSPYHSVPDTRKLAWIARAEALCLAYERSRECSTYAFGAIRNSVARACCGLCWDALVSACWFCTAGPSARRKPLVQGVCCKFITRSKSVSCLQNQDHSRVDGLTGAVPLFRLAVQAENFIPPHNRFQNFSPQNVAVEALQAWDFGQHRVACRLNRDSDETTKIANALSLNI